MRARNKARARNPTALCVTYIESVDQTPLLAAHGGGVVRALAAVVPPLQQTLVSVPQFDTGNRIDEAYCRAHLAPELDELDGCECD